MLPLQRRLDDNSAVLLKAYQDSAAELESGRGVVPAAEWLLDNYHLVEAQVREIRDDLPPGYYRQLPKLSVGPFAGYPRVFGIAWAFVAHTDSHLDLASLRRFIAAYQSVQPLTIGELWAVAITLRIVLIENMRRLADQMTLARNERALADLLGDRLVEGTDTLRFVESCPIARSSAHLSEPYAAQLAKRLRDHDPSTTPALSWLAERLAVQGASIEDAVLHAQQRQGASNLTVRNIITSLRLVSDIDWAEFFEDVSLVDARLNASSDFADMDFSTRNLYRSAIEELARGSTHTELEIADIALSAAHAAAKNADPLHPARAGEPGFYLIAEGRVAMEAVIGFHASPRMMIGRFNKRLGLPGYIGSIYFLSFALVALATLTLAGAGLSTELLLLFGILLFIPASEVATAIVNRVVSWSVGPMLLPGLELAGGVPTRFRTVIAVPTLLASRTELLEQIEQLEVHHLSGAGGDLTFALITDGLDADTENVESDEELLTLARDAISELNQRYSSSSCEARFYHLHRRRVFNECEGAWMGWERKRGKLHEFNQLLRGANDTSFVRCEGAPALPRDVRFVITLDADTRLPREAAVRLVGKMAHPLNRPRLDASGRRVIAGYAILQPRVTPSLPIGREGSLYQRIFSAPGGIDPYASAISDVYQDLFGEGSYTGKGIYDLDAFEAALRSRVPENSMLSHDLYEGIFARAGLVSDIEVVEEFPSRYDVAARRQHRWTRGDWQLLPWTLRPSGAPALGQWKMLDNLRRSLVAPFVVACVAFGWFVGGAAGAIALFFVLGAVTFPMMLPVVFAAWPHRTDVRIRNHATSLARDLAIAARRSFFAVAFMADQAWRAVDGIVRTLARVYWTRRNLLEWTTAAQSSASPRLDLDGFTGKMAGGMGLTIFLSAIAILHSPGAWPLVAPIALLWLAAPALALYTSRTPNLSQGAISTESATSLRLIARRTWRFFEEFVTPLDNMLPPDNFQEDPQPVVAHRTSPTNIGLYLLSTIAAHDFRWAGRIETVERLESTFDALARLPNFNGHLFNWYGTLDLKALDPPYVSSVDSGNLAGHLIAVANACDEWVDDAAVADPRPGMRDCLSLAWLALDDGSVQSIEGARRLSTIFAGIDSLLSGQQAANLVCRAAPRVVAKALFALGGVSPDNREDPLADVAYWLQAIEKRATEHERDCATTGLANAAIEERLRVLAIKARDLALAMDFSFLVEPERKLLSIGYSIADQGLDPNCYDLLASEARLASLFAIAKRDVPTRHWFRLGRSATPMGGASALISWSGSMFEYLMPSLVMRAPAGSLLEQTNRLVVQRQIAYGRSLAIPWGVSESAYNARDLEFTYQYSNFGVPGLGLKRGLAENVVIAPYATALAAMVDHDEALSNFESLQDFGGLGRYGFYEALDFSRPRLSEGAKFVVVKAFMAHHQGMTIVSIANTLHDGLMRKRFHREPIIQASELLLQERVPRDVAIAPPRAEEVKASASAARAGAQTVRRLNVDLDAAPATQLLSNGRYAVMVTTTGAGYSRWREIAVTRWREDVTCDDWGSFIYLRNVQTGDVWSAGSQVRGSSAGTDNVVFAEDHAQFNHRDDFLSTVMEVVVSGDDDGEVRRISLTNSGRRSCEIELTSYSEIVLSSAGSDLAHQAFSKLFVQTEHIAEFDALLATRRSRSHDEPGVWAAHFAVVEGVISAETEYESDRAKFIGRGKQVSTARVVTVGAPLSKTVGAVLDPIFSLRRRVIVPAGKVVRVAFWTMVAASRSELLDLIDKHHDRSAFDRARTLAWTQAQVQLRQLELEPADAADFQRLASPIIYNDRRYRASSEAIMRGADSQARLWQHSISGDLPIVLLRIDDVEDMGQLRRVLQAHEYWRMKRLSVDLVIINERASSYTQDLQIAIETAVRSSQTRPRIGDDVGKGSIFMLRADLITPEARALIHSVARVVLTARRDPFSAPVSRPKPIAVAPEPSSPKILLANAPLPPLVTSHLEFFNGLGGFDGDGKEYVVIQDGAARTPAPWINVISNASFGFQVSADGSGFTWNQNSRENQLTPWSNDPVCDPSGEVMYVRDLDSGVICCATTQPLHDGGRYISRHGFGYSRFEHEANGLSLELTQFVPLLDPVKISRLTLRNMTTRPRRLSVTAYAEWVLGPSRGASAPFIFTLMDDVTGAMMAQNKWNIPFSDRVAFSDFGGRQSSWTADRNEFLGRNGGHASPAALSRSAPLSGAVGAGYDPCAALQQVVELAPGGSVELVWLLGQSESQDEARRVIERYRAADLDAVMTQVKQYWQRLLGAVQVQTPDRAMDIMLNGWLLYQTLACRVMARTAFYQASGAYGFRDQLQDGMALSFAAPDETRRHLLRAAARQYVEGDVQHWWLPHTGLGVRSRISDDRVWLALATATYVITSGDRAVLHESVPFLDGPLLRPGEHESFYPTMIADEAGSLYEHCARGLDQSIELTGSQGLPLIGGGDWNDGMNRVGEEGRGESVWLGWLLIRAIALFAPLAEQRGDPRAVSWRAHAQSVCASIENVAWDGEWYRRATYDDGTWLGSKTSEECQIDSIAQSWAVLSGAADTARAETAMGSLDRHLVRRGDGLALLFTPPFDKTSRDPGYIMGYPPGLRENGGQYSHAAMWAMLALSKLGHSDRAIELFGIVNPISHARDPAAVERYKVEPYAVAADVYSVAPHTGRGGWTWYTGAAGWMYQAGIEGILGLQREGDFILLKTAIPEAWDKFDLTVTVGETSYAVRVVASLDAERDVSTLLDGLPLVTSGSVVRLPLDGRTHSLIVSVPRGVATRTDRMGRLAT